MRFVSDAFKWDLLPHSDDATYCKEVLILADRSKKIPPLYALPSLVATMAQRPDKFPNFLQHGQINYSVISLYPEDHKKIVLSDAEFQEKICQESRG